MRGIRPWRWGIAAAVLLAAVAGGLIIWRERASRALPYADSFAKRDVRGWTPYGGAWRIEDGVMVARSLERGVKLIAGSPEWTDYEASADIELRGHEGDLGLVVRLQNPAEGIDSYAGYFAGVRIDDSALVLGRSDTHWLSVTPVHVQGGVRTQHWFHLKVIAVGCQVVVEVRNLTNGAITTAGLDDSGPQCIRSGRVALRTTDTVGAWKNVRVRRATAAEFAAVRSHVPVMEHAEFPIREKDYNVMREHYLASVPAQDLSASTVEGGAPTAEIPDTTPLVTVDRLRTNVWTDAPERVVGVITSADPTFIQDSTAGVRLTALRSMSFQPGDEVEVLGIPRLEAGAIQLQPLRARFLWDRAPVEPLSVTSTQAAAGGRFDGTLIELSGVLLKRSTTKEGDIDLQMQDGAQKFSVHIPFDLFSADAAKFETGSRLKARGICSTNAADTSNKDAFALFANSVTDVVLLSGPPWWSGARLVWLLVSIFCLSAAGVYLFIVNERSKLRVIHGERQRLSHEMHDTLAQSLAGVGFKLQGIRRSMRESRAVPPSILDEVDATCEMVAGTHREASASIAALHPASQHEGDLLTLLERSVFSMLDSESLPAVIERLGEPRPMSPVVKDTLFRVGREAIANVLRHSGATEIKLTLQYRYRDLVLSVGDNGRGFADPNRRGFGLRSIERRCAEIRAQVEILSSPQNGSTVRVT
ncbi:MAG: histidine kinase, partial [Acidobacteriota bacterium]